ncbi:MAG TPA: cytochrome C [Gammaproteobacteria bacterium]|nr:cytochrome C [Gammaproteobacteria bacterium]
MATVGFAQVRSIERLIMPGPVVSAHAELENTCTSCHVPFSRELQSQLCLNCHDEIAVDLQRGTGFHGLSPGVAGTECAQCHTDHEGRDADIVGLDPAVFDHDLTSFPLLGKHADVICEDCHAPDQTFHEAQTLCYSCHAEDDRHRGNLGEMCADCHAETAWTDVRFDHDAAAGYPLTGAHGMLTCVSCHVEEQYEDTPNTCLECHRDDDTHLGTNGAQCQDCHTTGNWDELLFDHFTRSGFALSGGHSGLTCESCHEGNKLERQTSTECYGCHLDDDAHDGINGAACNDCHRVTEWLDVTFDHARDADFPLNGAHAELTCMSCHVEPVATALPATTCFGCHAEDDSHQAQLGESCATCHGEVGWTQIVRFDHDLTRFPLVGRHGDAVCEDCHATHAFLDAAEQCVDCHLEDDVHERRLGLDCGLCHNPNDWLRWTFDHDRQTQFALTGAHDNLDCHACHREPVAGAIELSRSCGSCHRSDDVHSGEFGQDCARCHTTESFRALRVLQ